MSQANDLLNNIVDEEPSIPLVEPHIVIGRDRKIVVPDSLKRLAVQFDHNIETVTFDCVRYWDNHDMSQMSVYITYLLPDGTTPGAAIAKNVRVSTTDKNIMHFDWTIEGDVTKLIGNIVFLVCVKKSGADGILENHWNSEPCKDCYISEGLNCTPEDVVEHYYPDLVNVLLDAVDIRNEMLALEERVNKDVEDVTNAVDVANTLRYDLLELKKFSYMYSNSLKGAGSGRLITFDDNVSPIEHIIKGKMTGGNLVPYPSDILADDKSQYNRYGLYIYDEGDGGVKLSGTSTYTSKTTIWIHSSIPVNKTVYVKYFLEGTMPDGCKLIARVSEFTGHTSRDIPVEGLSITIEGEQTIDLALSVPEGNVHFNDLIIRPMVTYEDSAPEYVLPVALSGSTVTACGKNLFPLNKWISKSYIDNDENVSATYYEQGYIEYCRVAGDQDIEHEFLGAEFDARLPAGNYYASLNVNNDEISLVAKFANGDVIDEGCGFPLELNEDTEVHWFIRISSGCDINARVWVWPQLEIGEDATEFETYVGKTYAPNADGTVDIKSIYPTTNLIVKGDVEFEAEYNRDISALEEFLEKETEALNDKIDEVDANLQSSQSAFEEQINEQMFDFELGADTRFANALKGHASGSVVRVDDVSPLEHNVPVKVKSVNHFNPTKYSTEKDYGNGKTIYAISAENLEIGKTYTVSAKIPLGWFKISNSANGWSCAGTSDYVNGFTSYTFEHNRDANIGETAPLKIYVQNVEKTALYDLSIQEAMEICIVEGEEPATEYTPYVNPETVTVTRYGVDETDNPQTYIPNADGTVSGVTSLAPTMTLFLDNPDAVMDVEYNRDITKAMKKVESNSGGSVKLYRHTINLHGHAWIHGFIGDVYIEIINGRAEPYTIKDNEPNGSEGFFGNPYTEDDFWFVPDGPASGYVCDNLTDPYSEENYPINVSSIKKDNYGFYFSGYYGARPDGYTIDGDVTIPYEDIEFVTCAVTEII